MTERRLLLAAALALAAWVQPRPSLAQADPTHLGQVAMANQTGAMEYCMDKGWADQAAVDAQRTAAASLPPATDQTGLREAEAMGRKGTLMTNGTTFALSTMAQRGNTTEQDVCTRMASAAKMVAAQRSSMPAFPAMPALPPGMTMPTMPAMPGMPTPQPR